MIAIAKVAPLLRGFGAAAPPTPPTLAVVDAADSSGAVATIADSAPGTTNQVFVQPFSGDEGVGAWQLAGARTGDGDVPLALAPGHYFAVAVSSAAGAAAVSGVVYFVVTDGVESLHARCLGAVQTRIRLLALPGLAAASVVVRKLPLGRCVGPEGDVELPAIVLSPRRAMTPPDAGTNALDDVHYDVIVTIFDRDNQEPTLAENLDRHLLWREQISRSFRNQRLTGVPEVINAAVEPAESLVEEAWKHELMVSALLLRFTSRETRGFS